MKDKFKNIPVDEDTVVAISLESTLGDYDVVYQKWSWDGIHAESIIFFNEDIENLSEEEIVNEVKLSPLLKEDTQTTYKKLEVYTFVNFNFISK